MHNEKPKQHLIISLGTVALAFFHGVTVTIILVLFINASYEDKLYDQLLHAITEPDMDGKEQVIALLHATHRILKPRQEIFAGQDFINIRDNLFRSADVQLIDARGNCGSYTHVLGRLLQRAGYNIRIAQMKCKNTWGCHILLEVNLDGKWAVLDALYDVLFNKPDGSLAGFRDVKDNWHYYKKQLPQNYDFSYAYEDVRYANWEKIPVIMPAIKEGLRMVMRNDVEVLSLRPYVLNVYKTYGVIAVIFYTILVAVSAFMFIRKGS
jgi:hypothetical protein